MKPWRILSIVGSVAVVFLIAGYALFSPQKTPDIQNFPSSGVDIIAFGDSLVTGYGSTNGNGFVALLSKRLNKPIINLGHAGDTTADALARVGELDRYHPKVVMVLLGGNDRLRRINPDTTFSNLGKIIAHIQSQGGVVLLLGIRGDIVRDPFAARFEELASQYRTGYVSDVLNGLFGNEKFMSDAVHPNDAGYAQIAERIFPVLLPLTQ
jgi:lysophospholipase L1-like esterase